MMRLLPTTGLLLLGGCVLNADKYPRPRDLTPDWQVNSLRLLAIAPEPPEIAPGEEATFSALYVDPDQTVGSVLWVACSPEETTSFGCAVDLSALDGEPTAQDLEDAGVIGFEPGLPPRWTAPLDALDDVAEADRLEGVQYTGQAVLLPEEGSDESGDELDFGTFEIGYKRIIVSEASTPNNNPVISGFTVEGLLIDADTVVEVDAGQAYELGLELPEATIEEYEYINPDGVLEIRVEEPFVSWYATDGEALESTTLYPFLQADWTAPDAAGVEGSWYAVVRDRRGGIAWIQRSWRTR